MSASPAEVSALRWLKPDAYHIRSECGRYSVARIDLGARDDYVAWLTGPPGIELDAVSVAKSARDEDRKSAIGAMKLRCLAHATSGEAA